MSEKTFYFGDSLTDRGNLVGALAALLQPTILTQLSLTQPVTPELIALSKLIAFQQATAELSQFGPNQALTNEFTHPTYAAQAAGFTVENYAVAGARAVGEQEPFGPGTGFDSNLGAQIDRFLADTGGSVAPGSSALLLIGSNDFSDVLGELQSDPSITPEQIEAAAADAIQEILVSVGTATATLAGAGVETIYLASLPPASFFPAFDGQPAELVAAADEVFATYNQLLGATAFGFGLFGPDVEIIDFGAVARAVTEDPSSFGIIADRGVFSGSSAAFDSDQIAFFDPLHPAEAIHQAWGAFTDFVMEGGESRLLGDGRDVSFGFGGDQAIFALGGNDVVFAGRGDDIVFSGSGNDRVFAGRGDDIVSGGSGNDLILGGRGKDLLSGGEGNDTVFGKSGNDVLVDGLGNDRMFGNSGNDTFVFTEQSLIGGTGTGADLFVGGRGQDTLYLVLDESNFDAFATEGAEAVLADLGVRTRGIESVEAIDGRGGIESALAGFEWFQSADLWGIVSAPTADPMA